MFTTCLFASIIACGQIRHEPATMPPLEHGILFKVEKGQMVEIDPTWRSDIGDENSVCVYNHATGERVKAWDSHGIGSPSQGAWTLPTNDNDEPVFYLVAAYSKEGGPDGSQPWRFALMKVVETSEKLVIIKTADFHNQQQYSSGKIKITSTKKCPMHTCR